MNDVVQSSIERIVGAPSDTGIVVGVSGGIDSMVLLDALQHYGHKVSCVHINHEQRDDESEADAELVRDFCTRKHISFTHVRIGAAIHAAAPKGSIQAAARKLRYKHLALIAGKLGIPFVATGHNKDDQAETVLINLLRGSGIDGLTGMSESRPLAAGGIQLTRPLIHVRRFDIARYANQMNVPWREDASNETIRYARNRLRLDTIPGLQALDVGSDLVDDIVEMSHAMNLLVDETLSDALKDAGINLVASNPRLPIQPLLALPPEIRSWLFLRAVRLWLPGAPARKSTVKNLTDLLLGPVGKRVNFRQGTLWRERDEIVFLLRSDQSETTLTGQEKSFDESVRVEKMHDSSMSDVIASGGETAMIDGAKVIGPLVIRRWQAGDRFIPLGMVGTRKVKRFLTDRKVPTSERPDVCVVCDDEKIIWIVGHQIDDRVRVQLDSVEILRLSISD